MQHNKLKSIIADKGINKKDIAQSLGITPQVLKKKLNGELSITIGEVLKICDILNITDNKEKCDIFLTSPTNAENNKIFKSKNIEDVFEDIFDISEALKKVKVMINDIDDYFSYDTKYKDTHNIILYGYEEEKHKVHILSDYLQQAQNKINDLIEIRADFIKI